MPDNAVYITTEVDRNELLDFPLQVEYTRRNRRISRHERKAALDALAIIGEDKLKTIATACGVDEGSLTTIYVYM